MKKIYRKNFLRFSALLLVASFSFAGTYPLLTNGNIAFAATCPSATNLVANGDFEKPLVTHPDKWDIFDSGTPDLGWTVEWMPGNATTFNAFTRPDPARLELQKSGHLGYLPYSGDQFAELDTDWLDPSQAPIPAEASVKIYQDIATTPGNTYTLNFAFSPRPDAAPANQNVLGVKFNNILVDTLSRASTSGQTEWLPYTYTLTATSSTTRLEFSDEGIPNSVGTYLDGVSLTCSGVPAIGGGGGVVIPTPAPGPVVGGGGGNPGTVPPGFPTTTGGGSVIPVPPVVTPITPITPPQIIPPVITTTPGLPETGNGDREGLYTLLAACALMGIGSTLLLMKKPA